MDQDENPYHSPNYYVSGNLQAIDVIDAFHLNFNLGNAIKYILRCEKKENKIKDLHKALWYIEHEIDSHEKKGTLASSQET